MEESLLLQAFNGTNKKIPVWFMRQAGRFLPQYRAIREHYTLDQMFTNPDIASEVTCQPVEILGVDAAILFADILTLPAQLGFEISFNKTSGPAINNPIQSTNDVNNICDMHDISYLRKTIQLINKKLPENIPLIGFAGSPFTVLSYLIEGGSTVNFHKLFAFMFRYREDFHRAMDRLTTNTIRYLQIQKDEGIKAYQIFDTWAGILREADYKEFVLPYLKRIFDQIDLPSIYYMKNGPHLLEAAEQTSAQFLSVCHMIDIGNNPVLLKTTKGVQGNLFNALLYADMLTLEKEVDQLLNKARRYKKYIFNLSHGIFPDTPVKTVQAIVKRVHEFEWNASDKFDALIQ